MKTILFALCLSAASASFAQTVFVNPVIFNFGNSLQVQINNNTADNLSCSGTVQAMTTLGRSQTFFYSDFIRSRSFSYRTFWLSGMGDRITNTFDLIRCSKAK
jgi:hypothetical protein